MHQGKLVFSQLMAPSAAQHVSPLRGSHRGEHKVKELLVPGSVSVHGLCAVDLSRELARHRVKPAGAIGQALPHGHSRARSRATRWPTRTVRDWRIYADFAQHLIRHGARAVRQRDLRGGTGRTRSTLSMPPPSICACRCFRGRHFARPRPPSNCIRCWTCAATFPASSTSPTARLHEVNVLDVLLPEAGRLLRDGPGLPGLRAAVSPFIKAGSFFVTRAKSNTKCRAALLASGGSSQSD